MNLPRQLAGTLLAIGGLMIALSMSSSSHGQATASFGAAVPPPLGTWTPTGSMVTSRYAHTETLLSNGKVLVTGGVVSQPITGILRSAELYDPSTGTWAAASPMSVPRAGHTATLLTDGHVLVAGGADGTAGNAAADTAEIYDPVSGTWTATGNLAIWLSEHTATLLSDGRVLIAGGIAQ
jgi:N-acetylneuraminic acid mutarotase